MNTLERIKLLAKQRDITIKELSIKLGIGENSLYRWDKTSPQSDKLQKVADFLTSQPTIYLVVPKRKNITN